MNKQREFIERIRTDEFGIGLDLQGQTKTAFDNMVRKYESLLSTVAEDLNSKESHFILELIQNADDNNYKPHVDPSLSFLLEKNRLVVKNNEVGFKEKNVRALCSAGESSKKSEKRKGYIGEKGIGFKSIFKVTNSPEIHSNGFHFRFDRSSPEYLLGYVVPHWHEPDMELDEQTTLVVPAKPGHQFNDTTLSDVSESLLLFLQKLRRLNVRTPDGQKAYERNDRGALTTLTTTKFGEAPVRQDFLRRTFKVDVSDIHELKREGITETEIVLAFPLSDSGEAEPIPGCATYAFLPIRDFGFNFYIQADFILASSREAIHEELPWNIRLRDAISKAFVESIDEFKRRPELARTYLKYLPTMEQVHDPFFAPVVDHLLGKLREVECIPAAGGGWKKPSDVLLASGRVRELFPPQDAVRLFGADYLKDDFVLPKASKQSLGFKSLTTTDVASIFTKHAEWVKSTSSGWKANFFAYLALEENRGSYVKLLANSPCIPLEGGGLAVPSEGAAFFPLDGGEKYGFEHELTILDAGLLKQAVEVSQEVTRLFADLGIKQDNPYNLIQSHILKLHADDKWTESDDNALIGHLRYIKNRLPRYLQIAALNGQNESVAMAALRDGLFVGTKNRNDGNWYFSRVGELYLAGEYRPDFDLESILGAACPPEKFISVEYMNAPHKGANTATSEQSISEWREFFTRLGVNESPRVITEPSGNVVCSEEMSSLLKSEKASIRRAALEVLDRNWAKYPSESKYTFRRGRNFYSATHGLITALRSTMAPTRKKWPEALSSAYAGNDNIRAVFGDSVTFVEAELRNTAFLDACGITYRVDAAACLNRLRQIKAKDVRSLDLMRKIFRCLESLWDQERATIEDAFSQEQLIKVGIGESAKWVSPNEACWRQTGSKYLDRMYPSLDGPYRDFHGFFVKKLKVAEALSLENWVEALKSIDAAEEDERSDLALSIYRRLSRAIGSHSKSGGELLQPAWLIALQTVSLLLNTRGEMVRKAERFYADDRPDVSHLFEDEEEISFLSVSANQLPSVSDLLDALEVQRVSDVVGIEVSPGVEGTINNRLTAKLREMLIPIARIVYSQSHAAFAEGIENRLFRGLRETSVLEVESLALTVTLGEFSREMTGQSASRKNEIVLDAKTRSKHDYVAMEVEKQLSMRRGASAHIGRVLMADSADDAHDYLEIQNVPELPDEELDALMSSFRLEIDPAIDPQSQLSDAPDPDGSDGLTNGEDENSDSDKYRTEVASKGEVEEISSGADSRHESGATNEQMGAPGNLSRAPEAGVETSGREKSASPVWNSVSDRAMAPAIRDRSNPDGTPERKEQGENNRIKRRPSTKSGRLLSYAEPIASKDGSDENGEPESQSISEHKQAVERAAVNFFLEKARNKWLRVEEMPVNNPGFDFFAEAFDRNHEFIEIKGQSGAWTEEGVALTPTELRTAAKHGEHYWLCVVEFALDESRRRLWIVRDPFGKANQFRFDRGWKDVAEKSEAPLMRPNVGLFVTIPELGKLKILEVMGAGLILRIKVELKDGNTTTKVFIPTTMKVSAE